jgi:uncharacterized protein (DUF488 family)
VIFTIGHSTHPLDRFLAILGAHGITGLADVRRIPGSRRHPHFSREALVESMPGHGIEYRHLPGLGGRRRGTDASVNTAWQHPSFRAYADHMASDEFREGLEELLAFAKERRVAVMCAEAQWWQCHRQLIADALVVRRTDVHHILAATRAAAHTLTSFARVEGISVRYPGLL